MVQLGVSDVQARITQNQLKIQQLVSDGKDKNAQEIARLVAENQNLTQQLGEALSGKTTSPTARQPEIDANKPYTKDGAGSKDQANDNIKNKYGYIDPETGKPMEKSKAKKLQKELEKKLKEFNKRQKELTKSFSDIAKSGDAAAIAEFNKKQAELNKELTDFLSNPLGVENPKKGQDDYDAVMAQLDISRGKGVKDIRKSAEKNDKNWTNVNDVATKATVVSSEDEKEALEADGYKGEVVVLKDKNKKTLVALAAYGDLMIQQAKAKSEQTGDPKYLEDAQKKYGKFTEMFQKDDKGNIDYTKLDVNNTQDVLTMMSGWDENLNLDEQEALKKMLKNYGVSTGDIKSTYKKLGYGVESALPSKAKAGLAALGITGLANVIGSALIPKTKHSAYDSAYDLKEGETVSKNVKLELPDGSMYKTTITAAGGTAEAFAEAFAEATAKDPVLKQLAGPLLAGIAAFAFSKGQTSNVFKADAAEALANLNTVDGAGAKAVMAKIQASKVPDEVKLAVLQACHGSGEAYNLEELQAGLQYIEQLDKMKLDIEDPEPEPEPEPEPDPIRREETTEEIPTEFNVKHKSGMGPWQYAEALGVPKEHIREFVNMFRDDNNMDKAGVKFNKTPKLRNEYTFKDGTTFSPGTKDEAQKKIDGFKVQTSNKPGKWTPVQGKAIATITRKNGRWVWATDANGHKAGDPVPASQLKTHPTYIQWCEDNGVQP